MKKYCVIREAHNMKNLMSLINSNFLIKSDQSHQEYDLNDILTTVSTDLGIIIKYIWYDLENMIGYPIKLLGYSQNESELFCLIVKLRADESSDGILNSIYIATGIKIDIKNI